MGNPTEQFANSRPRLVRLAQARPLTLFFLLAYVWTWIVLLAALRLPGQLDDAFAPAIIIAASCGPTLAALITRWLGHRDLKICPVWTGWRPLLAGLAVGLVGFFVATVVAPAAAIVHSAPSALHWSVLLHWGTYDVNYSTFLGGPVGEEPGWRGFALPRLQSRYGPFKASVILAPLWAAWHLPLFFVPGWTTASPWQFVLILLGVSFLLTSAANWARFGVLAAIALHAFFNTSSRLVNALGSDLPARSHQGWLYALAVFICGVAIGIATLGKRGRSVGQFFSDENLVPSQR